MCQLCEPGRPSLHPDAAAAPAARGRFRRDRAAHDGHDATHATGAMALFASPDHGHPDARPAPGGGRAVRTLIRGGAVLSMDPAVGDFASADVLVEGSRILAVGPNIAAPGAQVVPAEGRIVMPGFIDTHHHLFETALRSYLADGLLMDGLDGDITNNYFQRILLGFAPQYRPEDVFISTLFGSLSQLDAGVTTVLDVSQIHHSPAHSDASIEALRRSGRRAAWGYFESAGSVAGNAYPGDARRIRQQHFASHDQLLTMVMGGEIYLPGHEQAWAIGRELGLPVAAHIVTTFGMRPVFDALAEAGAFGPDNLFIHMTGMSDMAWQRAKDAGVGLSLSVPIEMNMRHGTPPLQQALDLGFAPSLSTDVECTLTADMFTQMRSAMAMQRMAINGRALGEQGTPPSPQPKLLTTRDVLRMATVNGARDLKLDHVTGSLTPGKQADLLILDAEAINVAPLNHVPGAVVSLMERSNVESVMVAGHFRKWQGRLLDVDLPRLRGELERSRDHLFQAAGIPQDLFRAP